MTVGGRKLYILTELEYVKEVYKNNITLYWYAMLHDLLIKFGIKFSIIRTLWQNIPAEIP